MNSEQAVIFVLLMLLILGPCIYIGLKTGIIAARWYYEQDRGWQCILPPLAGLLLGVIWANIASILPDYIVSLEEEIKAYQQKENATQDVHTPIQLPQE